MNCCRSEVYDIHIVKTEKKWFVWNKRFCIRDAIFSPFTFSRVTETITIPQLLMNFFDKDLSTNVYLFIMYMTSYVLVYYIILYYTWYLTNQKKNGVRALP